MSSQIHSRTKVTTPVPPSQDPNGEKKPQEMTPKTHKSRLDSLTANRKPSWTWMVAAAGSLLVSAIMTMLLFETFSIIGLVLIAGLLYIASMYIASRIMEDRLKAIDEFWRHLIWTAFLIALIPLISVIWSVVSEGLPTLIAHPGLLTTDMQGVVGADDIATQTDGAPLQGGILHGLVGTVIHDPCQCHFDSGRPIRLDLSGRILQPKRFLPRNPLLRRRYDRYPLDCCRSVRLCWSEPAH